MKLQAKDKFGFFLKAICPYKNTKLGVVGYRIGSFGCMGLCKHFGGAETDDLFIICNYERDTPSFTIGGAKYENKI